MEFIRTSIEGEIATVTLDHPCGNRINFAMRSELLEAFGIRRATRAARAGKLGLKAVAQIRPEDVFVGLTEVAKENWSFGKGEAQYA